MWREEGCSNDVVVRLMSARLAYGMSYTAICQRSLKGNGFAHVARGHQVMHNLRSGAGDLCG